ncbi:TIR domain-containing protein [Clostridium cylindrosporum]|uniref:Thoeris protein ThsB TIR-like domain-containing protein n=1 Tax=Clostridium cylindrosporum DSM 605 TaxID=1121307 RepID=A0A0J8D7M9_CLOCY|nr:hypothetical protein [Clostridium cylindrosporum]KMT21892.1 hypothetical protein CLCY_3c01630 [Clostridium cylindrosporum DSM 605]
MIYRTRTYIAADWTDDKDAVDQLMKWNSSKHWGLTFGDAHELSQCLSDDTNNCNIKKNCSQNFDHSKFFVLIVGDKTKSLRSGYCMYCKAYSYCQYTYKTNKSYVEYECDYAVRNNLPIIVLYNSTTIDKSKCIDSVVKVAKAHAKMVMYGTDNKLYWDYQSVKDAFDKLAMPI